MTTVAARVRKHRTKLRGEHCRRLDVGIAGWIVEGIRQLAKAKGHEPWSEIQDVLERYLMAHGDICGAPPANLEYRPTSETN